jgi:hypothetical protein
MMGSSQIPISSGTRATKIPEIGFCEEKNRLLCEFLKTIREISELQSQQMQAVLDAAIDGEGDFMRFDLLLHLAQQKKEQAKYAWIEHVEGHGCHEGSI